MALTTFKLDLACKILFQINPEANKLIQIWNEAEPFTLDSVKGCPSKLRPDFLDNVFMDIKDITPLQLEIWNARKDELDTPFLTNFNCSDGLANPCTITRIGWY